MIIVDHRLGTIPLEHLASILIRWWPAIRATAMANPRQAAFVVPSRFTKRGRLPKWVCKPRRKRKPSPSSATQKQKPPTLSAWTSVRVSWNWTNQVMGREADASSGRLRGMKSA